jgi:hypothetical protein
LPLAVSQLLTAICILAGTASAQVDGRVVIRPQLDPAYDRFTFDVVIKRQSQRWTYFANTTIRLESVDLDPTGGFNPSVHQIGFIPDSSDLNLVPYSPAAMNGYFVDYGLVNGDFVVHVLGPDSVQDAHDMFFTADTARIGRFVITSNDGSYVPEFLRMAQPLDYYQASAFKLDHDSVTGTGPGSNVWFVKHDNPPLVMEFDELPPPPDTCGAVFNFYGSYVGDLRVMLGFDVTDEHCYEGFFIERALVERAQPDVLNFQGRAQLTYLNEPRLRSCLCLDPQVHDSLFDDVEFRREVYAYRLLGKRLPFYGDTVEIIDTIFIRIPNAIISNARILENPFKDQTTIRFNADDRLLLTAKATDLGGRLIGYLENEKGQPVENMEYPLGVGYELKFRAPDTASQGLYNILLVGMPMHDESVAEGSRVIIKAQLLR